MSGLVKIGLAKTYRLRLLSESVIGPPFCKDSVGLRFKSSGARHCMWFSWNRA